jgi:hypothetical protein
VTIYQWLCLFGVPTIILTVLKLVFNHNKALKAEMQALKLGLQALLRAQMISEYNKWDEKGYAPIYARQNFENCWMQYHSLGANGVMDDIHERFLRLPSKSHEK